MASKKKLLITLVVGTGLLFLYTPAFVRWAELKARQSELETEIQHLTQENLRLYAEMKRLREDPSYAEAVARRELGFVRPGEKVVKFREEAAE